jgi:hypothetical protein
VPAATWNGINWIAIPGGHSPAIPGAGQDPPGQDANLEGWSRGYVEFVWNPQTRTLTPWSSADGLTWSAGSRIDISIWGAELTAHDKEVGAVDTDCAFDVIGFHEGPAAVLLRGSLACSGGCGGPWSTTETMWSSPDGRSWIPADMPKIFGAGGVGPISGGSNGFVALGESDSKQTLWTSTDGAAWHHGVFPAAAVATGAWVDNPASIAGVYVLPGVLLVKKGTGFMPHQNVVYGTSGGYTGGGCVSPSPTDKSTYQSAVWWSADGVTWTRATLPGLSSTAGPANMGVFRIDDHTVVADQETFMDNGRVGAETQWASTDGKTWALMESTANIWGSSVVSGRDHGLVQDWATNPNQTWPALCTFTSNLSLATLKQTGSVPWINNRQMALGPTGLLVTEDGSRFWMGVPTAG